MKMSTIMAEVFFLAEGYAQASIKQELRNTRVPSTAFIVEKAIVIRQVLGDSEPDPQDETLVDQVTEAVWRANLPEARANDVWPEDVIGRTEDMLRDWVRGAFAELREARKIHVGKRIRD